MLIIIDPTESLKHAQHEAESLCAILEDNQDIEIELIGGRQADKFSLISEMRDKDLILHLGSELEKLGTLEAMGKKDEVFLLYYKSLRELESSP